MSFIDTAVNAISSVFNTSSQASENDKNREHDVDMANLSYDLNEQAAVNAYNRDMDFWEIENQYNYDMLQENREYNEQLLDEEREYNSFSSVRDRLEEAGINPAVYFSNNSGTTASSTSATSSAASSSGLSNSAKGGANTTSTAGKAPQINPQDFLIMAQAKKLNAETEKLSGETDSIWLSNDFQKASYDDRLKLIKLDETLKSAESKYATFTLEDRVKLINQELQDLGYRAVLNRKRSEFAPELVMSELGGSGGWAKSLLNQIVHGSGLFPETNSGGLVINGYNNLKDFVGSWNSDNEKK